MRADALAVKRVLTNLLVNALTYTASGGFVRADVRFEDGAGVLTLTDSGTGFTASERSKAGKPFERFDRTGTVTGAGLGLAIAMELTRRMGGAMRLAGQPGQRRGDGNPAAPAIITAMSRPRSPPVRPRDRVGSHPAGAVPSAAGPGARPELHLSGRRPGRERAGDASSMACRCAAVRADDNQNALSLDFQAPVNAAIFDQLPRDLPQWIAMAYASFDNGVIRATRPVSFLTRREPDGFSLRIVARGPVSEPPEPPPFPPPPRCGAASVFIRRPPPSRRPKANIRAAAPRSKRNCCDRRRRAV